MRQITTCVILMGAAALVACASQTPTPAPKAATATTHATAPATALVAQQGQKPASFSGYRRVVKNGQELFCRNEIVTGSNIKQQTCLTRAQIEAQQNNSQQYLQNNTHNARTCSATFGLGGNPCQD
jgi:hypothetical protein